MPNQLDFVIDAMESLGDRPLSNAEIFQQVSKIAPQIPEASIRRLLGQNCVDDDGTPRGKAVFISIRGLAAHAGLWKLAVTTLDPTNLDVVLDGADAFETEEGRAILRVHLRRERSRKLIIAFKDSLQEARCEACSINFTEVYGTLGKDYIEAHHIIPVADLEPGAMTSIKDLAALCANCHRVIHRNQGMSVQELKKFLANPHAQSEPRRTWKEAVKAALKRMSTNQASDEITRKDLIDAELSNIVAEAKSQGMTPSQTLSRVLQELREEGAVEFSDYEGTYKILF